MALVGPGHCSIGGVLNAQYGAYPEGEHCRKEHPEPREDIGRCHHQTVEDEQRDGSEDSTEQDHEASDNNHSDGRGGAQEHRVKTD